jgi:hypothetical protein
MREPNDEKEQNRSPANLLGGSVKSQTRLWERFLGAQRIKAVPNFGSGLRCLTSLLASLTFPIISALERHETIQPLRDISTLIVGK